MSKTVSPIGRVTSTVLTMLWGGSVALADNADRSQVLLHRAGGYLSCVCR
jgi:hypothetical protein